MKGDSTPSAKMMAKMAKLQSVSDLAEAENVKHAFLVDGTSREDKAGFLSTWLMLFMNPILRAGSDHTLTHEELGAINNEDKCDTIQLNFDKFWALEQAKPAEVQSLWLVLWRTVGWIKIFSAMFYYLIYAGISFGPILILNALVQQVQGTTVLSQGVLWFLVAMIFALPMAGSLFSARSNVIMAHISVEFRNILVNKIYRKSMLLSPAARQKASTGQIITMFSNDTKQLQLFLFFMNNAVVAPFQIIIALALIYQQVGNVMFIGLAFMVILIPMNGFIFVSLNMIRRKKVKVTDSRVKLTNEILSGIRVIKYYAWEAAFTEKVKLIRNLELELLKQMAYIVAIGFTLILQAAPIIQPILIFYTYVKLGNSLDAATAFTTISLFNIMQQPFAFLPLGLAQFSQSLVSTKRMLDFFNANELEGYVNKEESADGTVISMENVSMCWIQEEAPKEEQTEELKPLNTTETSAIEGADTVKMKEEKEERGEKGSDGAKGQELKCGDIGTESEGDGPVSINRSAHTLIDISFRIKKGQLVAVVGAVGCGKSSLLSGLLGEMQYQEGKVQVAGSIAYCDLRPWILNTTVKENILFGEPFDEDRFDRAIHASSLEDDIKVLPGGVLTEIGERGINLSGGQKSRVALARAVYRDADVYLLDDPLSAVDAHVGQHIFHECILGALKDKTRVLVTHQVHLLHLCDLIIVMEQGAIKTCGTYEELENSNIDIEAFVKKNTTEDEEDVELNALEAKARRAAERLLAGSSAKSNESEVTSGKEEKQGEEEKEGDEGVENKEHDRTDGRDDIPVPTEHVRVPPIAMVPMTGVVDAIAERQWSFKSNVEEDLEARIKGGGGGATQEEQMEGGQGRESEIMEEVDLAVVTKGGRNEENAAGFAQPGFRGSKKNGIENYVLSKEATDAANARKSLNRESTTLTTIEEKAEGDVMWPTYSYYIKAGGLGKFFMVMVFICLYQALVVVASYWLAYWGTVVTRRTIQGNPLTADENVYFLDYYALYTMMGVIALTVRAITLAQHRLGTSLKLHEEMVDAVFGAPVAFFDVTPQGRLLNRFSSDMVVVDEELSQSISQLTNSLFSVFGAIAAIAAATQGIFLALCLPLVILYEKIQRYFRKSNTAIARLQSVSLSPIYTDFSQALAGLSTIRAYGVGQRFVDTLQKRVDYNTVPLIMTQLAIQWLAIRLDFIGSLISLFIAVLAIASNGLIPASFLALGLTYSFQMTTYLKFAVRMIATAEAQMNSVERIKFYIDNIEQEDEYTMKGPDGKDVAVPEDWPKEGAIVGTDIQMRYRDGPLVLKGVDYAVAAGEKIGIAGRTGSGKSSMMIGLFRIQELAAGRIMIDGIDTRTVPLRTLRSRLGIIPQDPVIFSASVRFNLDPFEAYSDMQIWGVLESVDMKEHVMSLPAKLSEDVAEGGDNFSTGQRQLICIARALLRTPKILVLDEATASIDNETDIMIQKMVRINFKECTVLTIAHRLNTIIDSDKIIVMEAGLLAEMGPPEQLLANEGGPFKSLWDRHQKSHETGSNKGSKQDLVSLAEIASL